MRRRPSAPLLISAALAIAGLAASPRSGAADAAPAAADPKPPASAPHPAASAAGDDKEPAATTAALPFSGQISGTIYSHTKSFVTGSSVAVVGTSGDTIRASSTDERGHYALKGLEKDEYAVFVMDPAGALVRKDRVSVRPLFRNLVDFILAPPGAPQPPLPRLPASATAGSAGFTLDVTLRSREGQSVPEAWVIVSFLHEGSSARRARTDAQGSVRFDDLPPGYYRLGARALGHVTWNLGPLLLEDEAPKRLDVTLLPFPLGHEERIEDLLVPVEPATPAQFEAESSAHPATEDDPNHREPS